MKALINYKIDKNGQKHIITAQQLHTTQEIDFEIVQVSKYADMNKLAYNEDNELVQDKEKLELQKQIEEMAEELVNKEFELLKGDM